MKSIFCGRHIVFSIRPDKLQFFQNQVAKRREGLLNYMLFLRLTPTLPNTFINLASPIMDVPYHIFFLATIIRLIPAGYVTVRNITRNYHNYTQILKDSMLK
ncbi:hypothetical protein GBA52_015217 [Prunus armeniaca]|nr:hypothetical protein GBA52_015217 [Prunus armeniaca]